MSTNQNLQIQQDPFSGLIPNTLASAASVSPTNAVTLISGTTSIATIVPPSRATHQLTFIFTDEAPAAFLTSGNVAVGVIPVTNSPVVLQYEPRTEKYYPISTGATAVPNLSVYTYTVPVAAGGAGTFNPADSTTYLIGGLSSQAPTGASELSSVPVITAGTIVAAVISVVVNGTTATTEASTIFVRNCTAATQQTIDSALLMNALGPNVSGSVSLGLAVGLGDRVGIRLVTPAWGTNPTAVQITGLITIRTASSV